MTFRQRLLRIPLLGRFILIVFRWKTCYFAYFRPRKKLFNRWLFNSREIANFTYDLQDTNKRYLCYFVSEITGVPHTQVAEYIKELESDTELKEHVTRIVMSSDMNFIADSEMYYGRRLGWYALVRARKPKVVIETGVDKGLGSCILAKAIMLNQNEGFGGRYYGTEIETDLGYLLSGKYKEYGEILFGDSIESLKKFEQKIDFFINDSDHSADYEEREYNTIIDKLTDDAIIIGDNAHVTDKLINFAGKTNRRFLFFKEVPKNHWYSGAGIGVAFKQ